MSQVPLSRHDRPGYRVLEQTDGGSQRNGSMSPGIQIRYPSVGVYRSLWPCLQHEYDGVVRKDHRSRAAYDVLALLQHHS